MRSPAMALIRLDLATTETRLLSSLEAQQESITLTTDQLDDEINVFVACGPESNK